MVQSFKFTFKSLKNTKGFMSSMIIMPIIMILLITITLAYSNIPMVGYVGNGEKIINLESIRTTHIQAEDINYFLGSSKGTLVVELDHNGNIAKYYSSIRNNPLINLVDKEFYNGNKNGSKNAPKVEYSLGIILFKLLTAAGLLAIFLIQEKNNGIFVRIKNAKKSITTHVIGKALAIFLVYEIANTLILAFYYFAGFDFGNANIYMLFFIFTITLLISMGIYVFIASYLNNEGKLWVFSTGILFPLALCSGVLFPIEFMPNWMKVIAQVSPQYYLQKSVVDGEIMYLPITIMLILSFILMFFGIRSLMRKT